MNLWKITFTIVCAASCYRSAVCAAELYPPFSGPVATLAEDEALMQVFAQITKPMADAQSSELAKRQRLVEAVKELEALARAVHAVSWPVVAPAGRMPLPSVLIHPSRAGLSAGVDAHFFANMLAQGPEDQAKVFALGLLWSALLQNDGNTAFEIMAKDSNRSSPTTLDVLRAFAAFGYRPGFPLENPPKKEVWERLHRSTNPCYRLIALEKFDSVEQSPAELLALYRECLIDGCSYLESRALEAIYLRKDYRPEVAQLLKQYAALKTPTNDGTLPSLRNTFPSLSEGTTWLIETVEKEGKSPPSHTTDEKKQSLLENTPATQENTKHSRTNSAAANNETCNLTPWSIIVVLMVAAIGLLWLLLKRRS